MENALRIYRLYKWITESLPEKPTIPETATPADRNEYQKQLEKWDDDMNDARILIEEGIADQIRIRMRDKGYNRQTATPAITIEFARQAVFHLGADIDIRIAEE